MKLMQHRTLWGILPVRQQETNQVNYERFRARKSEHSQYQVGQDLPKFPVGSNVLYYSSVRNLWSPGVIVDRVHNRSYTIISQKGRMLYRNRIELKPYNKEVIINIIQTNKQTQTENIPHHIHLRPRPIWFTPKWLTPTWVHPNHHHRQTDIVTNNNLTHCHTHQVNHHRVTHHKLYHPNHSKQFPG